VKHRSYRLSKRPASLALDGKEKEKEAIKVIRVFPRRTKLTPIEEERTV
jgi:hypothetical protein